MFSVWGTGSQAVLSIFLCSFRHTGQGFHVGCTFLSVRGLCYPSGRLSDGWEGAGFLPLSTVTPLFLPSFDCGFPFPPSFVHSFLLLLSSGPGSRYGGLVKISSGECLVSFSKSRCIGSGHPLQVRAGHKACSRSLLRWCDSYFLRYFRDNPRQDWHDGSTVSPWP